MSQSRDVPSAFTGLRWSGWSEGGQYRPNNEDAFLGVCFDGREIHHLGKFGQEPSRSMDFAFAVSDGLGGAKAGEYASRITTEKLALLLPRCFRQSAAGLEAGFTEVLEELFDQIHRRWRFWGPATRNAPGWKRP